jgi:4-amino-4-deoxy-L-arabinose transferase-like glycosyltransferase
VCSAAYANASRALSRLPFGILPLVVVLSSFLLKLRHLGHKALHYWDESYHALVARNLLRHPLKPTLVENPYLPVDPTSWGNNHVWLHKPTLPMWTIALSYAVLGVDTFALRLPSALMSTGAVWFTYLIGKELLDRRAGLIAAAVQAFNPAMTELVHGYLYSDHIDVALLFWVEAGMWCLVRALRGDTRRYMLLAGVAQGCAYLSKSYLAAIIAGVAVTAWLLPVLRIARPERASIRGKHILWMLGATLATVAPWTLYCILEYPTEFWHEHTYVWRHLNEDIEAWGAPWDRLLFDYASHLYHVFYTPMLVAALALLWPMVTRRSFGLWLVQAWGLGVLLPHVLATTKTPSATVMGMPPFFLLLGCLISRAWSRDRKALTAWVGIMVMCLAMPPVIKGWGRGYTVPAEFAGVAKQAMWITWHVLGAFCVAALVAVAHWFVGRWSRAHVAATAVLLVFASATAGVLGWRMVRANIAVVNRNEDSPSFSDIARYAREELPENAVLLFDYDEAEGNYGEHQLTMYLSYRTAYEMQNRTYEDTAPTVIEHGGIPYVVSFREQPLPVVYRSEQDARTIYSWPGPGAESAQLP